MHLPRLGLSFLALALSATLALAQTPAGTIGTLGAAGAYNSVPKTCTNGAFCYLQTDVNGNLLVSASVSASVTGFAPVTTGTPITATTGGVTGTLPSGAVVVAFNTGATNTAYCKLGATSTTSDIAIPPASWFSYTVGAATQLTCITSTSTTTVNMVGGSGLPTGAGGGGGGSGGGGAVTIADGADVTEGAIGDAAATQGSTGTISAKLRTMTGQLNTIATSVAGAIPTQAETVSIGGVGLKPSSSSSNALTKVSCGSGVSSCVLKASAGNLYGTYAVCTSACWLMVFNATSAPSNGATTAGIGSGNLVECVDISAGSSKSLTYAAYPAPYSVGITAVISSTACATLTLSTVGFVSGSVL